jgi:hypothetical protein
MVVEGIRLVSNTSNKCKPSMTQYRLFPADQEDYYA